MPAPRSDFLGALIAAPAGIALLGRLEARHRAEGFRWEVPHDSSIAAVWAAVTEIATMSFGTLLAVALDAGFSSVGPWSSSSMEELRRACAHAEARYPIAEAVALRFADQLHIEVERDNQEWWQCGHIAPVDEVLTGDFDHVYGNGEFPWAAVRTISSPPSECHQMLLTAWEFDDEPVLRWRLPINADARVYAIHRPEDWVTLVERYPKVARRPHAGWELPGPNQHYVPRDAFTTWGPHVVRQSVERHVLPDWAAVAEHFDGVHLSWAGWLTSEGFISDLPSGGVTMLRYWFSDRSFWLRNVFGNPAPLPQPADKEATS